jgi:hypothetical protein
MFVVTAGSGAYAQRPGAAAQKPAEKTEETVGETRGKTVRESRRKT